MFRNGGKNPLRKIANILDEYETIRDKRISINRRKTYYRDPNAPICIRCCHCAQQGFIYLCPSFSLPEEDGKVVGEYGMVYYMREGHKPKTYRGAPMESSECKMFERLW